MALNTQISNRLISDLQRDFGLSLGAAQGIVGALAMESGGFNSLQEINPTVNGSRGGFGYAQWTGPRRRAFEAFASQQGLDPSSYDANYQYLSEELRGVGGHDGGLLRRLSSVTDPQQAQALTTDVFLRPGIVHPDARVNWTRQVVGATSGNAALDAINQQTGNLSPSNAANRLAYRPPQPRPRLNRDIPIPAPRLNRSPPPAEQFGMYGPQLPAPLLNQTPSPDQPFGLYGPQLPAPAPLQRRNQLGTEAGFAVPAPSDARNIPIPAPRLNRAPQPMPRLNRSQAMAPIPAPRLNRGTVFNGMYGPQSPDMPPQTSQPASRFPARPPLPGTVPQLSAPPQTTNQRVNIMQDPALSAGNVPMSDAGFDRISADFAANPMPQVPAPQPFGQYGPQLPSRPPLQRRNQLAAEQGFSVPPITGPQNLPPMPMPRLNRAPTLPTMPQAPLVNTGTRMQPVQSPPVPAPRIDRQGGMNWLPQTGLLGLVRNIDHAAANASGTSSSGFDNLLQNIFNPSIKSSQEVRDRARQTGNHSTLKRGDRKYNLNTNRWEVK